VLPLHQGIWLQAMEKSAIALPGAIIQNNETFESVMKLSSDDMEIGFHHPDSSKEFKLILIRFNKGDSVILLKRGCDVFLIEHEGQAKEFRLRRGYEVLPRTAT
jgi:hypothetical protein